MKIVSTAPPEILWDRIQHDVHHVAPTILTRGGRGPIWSVRFEGMAFAIAHHASILEARGTVEPTSTGGSILSFHIVPSPSWGPLIYIVPVFILGALRAITMAAGLAAILIASESMSAIGYWRHIHHWVREAEGPHPYPTILAREKSPYTADPDRTLRPGPTLLGMVLILVLGLMIAWAFGVMAES